ncbi:ATP-binding cassette domain-containing protein [uncultured Rhodoblastus sp.]|uniref:energy-coupling factor ABC transporter ATP-binding protein n=1 Tax=uncultured Rhodoblastus sp. TaxID=543037 RepID=UPI0025E23221|nr:ATP-binding cassette domain-containing protein [uncultured Rhodoblastus sp.]
MTLLEAQALTYAYPGGVPALSGLDLRVERGRRLAILGPNGAGKTTLLLHLNGTLRPSSGRVLLDGAAAGYSREKLSHWRRRVGLVLQDSDDQLFAASVAEDVSFGPLNLGLSDEEARARVEETLAALAIADLADRPTHMLSFGQKKRAALAGAAAMRPEILLLDEPTAGLDQRGATLLLDVLKQLQNGGTTLVFTTHDADLAWAFADDVALFGQGRVIVQGAAGDILVDAARMNEAGLTVPFLAQIGLKLRRCGALGAQAPLPRDEASALALFPGAAVVGPASSKPQGGPDFEALTSEPGS